jgi:putative heme-binding domain-containing protein
LKSKFQRRLLALLSLFAQIALISSLHAQTRSVQEQPAATKTPRAPKADWIWVAGVPPNQVPRGTVYFRKSIQLAVLEKAQLEIGANDAYEVFINGRRVGNDNLSENIKTIDVTTFVRPGMNVIAVRADNVQGTTAGLFARLYVKPRGEGWRGLGTSETWLSSNSATTGWQTIDYDDRNWRNARFINGPASTAAPMQTVASKVRIQDDRLPSDLTTPRPLGATSSRERFSVDEGFTVEELLTDDETGSLIAMSFNEFGHIIASQEGGPLLLIYDANKDGKPEKIRTYSDRVKNIQGILPLNGDVFVTGDGDQGNGLYRLMDQNRDGKLEQASLIVGFEGTPGEHGAHQLVLGPDGMIYVVVGNHVQVKGNIDPASPYSFVYEGDLVQPREEDPGGHAQGIRAPGGTVIRVELSGEKVQVVAGGLRNAYDLAFHPSGALFVHDSDMEADIGTTWLRATSLFQIVEGGEYGWRSGWANQPEFYLDRLPSLSTTGRSSPTGCIVYNHNIYPKQYHQNLFLADWSEGRILRVDTRPNSEGQIGEPEVFAIGRPMNITDIDVGQDGHLYFCTGGRGTSGGIYRIRWTGDVPKEQTDLGEGVAKAIRQPQMHSAWGRQAVALQKRSMGEDWDEQIAGVAYSPDNPARYRIRALDLMQLLGPVPSADLLVELSRSSNEAMRVKAASLLALHTNDEQGVNRLNEMLGDPAALVQQAACEALIRGRHAADAEELIPLLKSDNRTVSFVATRLLAKQSREVRANVLSKGDDTRLVIQGSLATVLAEPSRETAIRLLPKLDKTATGYVSDRDFIDLLRVYELALYFGGLQAADCPELSDFVANEFPAGDPRINRQLIRLATHLRTSAIVPLALEYLKSNQAMSDRVDIALHLQRIPHQWTGEQRSQLLSFYEEAQRSEAGSSYSLYVMNATREFSRYIQPEEAIVWVMDAKNAPNAALAALPKLPATLPGSLVEKLILIDEEIDRGGFESDVYKRLKTGIAAVLARSGDETSIKYLRQVWRRSPDRRASVALALAQDLEGDNWDYVVRSLHILDSNAVPEILSRLTHIGIATEDADAIRQVIVQGLRLDRDQQNPAPALRLLEHWTGTNMSEAGTDLTAQLASWQNWYRGKYPNQGDPVLPEDQTEPRWSLEFIEQFLDGDSGKQGSYASGMAVYQKAQCAACHKMNEVGTTLGPELTSLTKRFNRQEALESILYPSHVVSDQYATKKVMTSDGLVVTGLVTQREDSQVVRTADRQQIQIPNSEIEEIIPSKTSLMPTGLLDDLSPVEIRDLMCYLGYVAPLPTLAEPASQGGMRR